jgi:hypothetical protein
LRQAHSNTARIRPAFVSGATELDQCEDVLVVEQFACVARGRKFGRKWLHD